MGEWYLSSHITHKIVSLPTRPKLRGSSIPTRLGTWHLHNRNMQGMLRKAALLGFRSKREQLDK